MSSAAAFDLDVHVWMETHATIPRALPGLSGFPRGRREETQRRSGTHFHNLSPPNDLSRRTRPLPSPTLCSYPLRAIRSRPTAERSLQAIHDYVFVLRRSVEVPRLSPKLRIVSDFPYATHGDIGIYTPRKRIPRAHARVDQDGRHMSTLVVSFFPLRIEPAATSCCRGEPQDPGC